MHSREHFLSSLAATGLALAPALDRYSAPLLVVLAAYGVGLGVFVDLDHFLLARLRVGHWGHLRAALRDPLAAFTDQAGTFDDVEGLAFERLLSHVLVGGALTALAFALLGPPVALLTAVVMYVHVVADLLWEAYLAPDRAVPD